MRVFGLFLFFQAALLGLGGGIREQKQRAHDTGGEDVDARADQALKEDLVSGLGIHHNVQHGGDQHPGQQMGDRLPDIEADGVVLGELAVLKRILAGQEADGAAEEGGSDDPAPPYAPAVAEVDEKMPDQARKQSGDGP